MRKLMSNLLSHWAVGAHNKNILKSKIGKHMGKKELKGMLIGLAICVEHVHQRGEQYNANSKLSICKEKQTIKTISKICYDFSLKTNECRNLRYEYLGELREL